LAGFYAGGVKQWRGSLRELCEFSFIMLPQKRYNLAPKLL